MSLKKTKDYCPLCQQITNHECLYNKSVRPDNDDELPWEENFEIVQCLGCENVQFRKRYSDDTMIGHDEYGDEFEYDEKKYYPATLPNHRLLKNIYYLPEKVRLVYNETLEVLRNNCYLLSGVGLRAIIEAICLDQNITGRNLEIKINNLVKNKLITEKDGNRLHSVRFLGNDSVHEMDIPKEEKLRIALDIVENLIKNIYLIDIDANLHLDTIISNYEDFKNLIARKVRVSKLNQGEEKNIKEILSKDYRRIEQNYITNFIQQYIDEINNGTIKILSIGKVENGVQFFVKT